MNRLEPCDQLNGTIENGLDGELPLAEEEGLLHVHVQPLHDHHLIGIVENLLEVEHLGNAHSFAHFGVKLLLQLEHWEVAIRRFHFERHAIRIGIARFELITEGGTFSHVNIGEST